MGKTLLALAISLLFVAPSMAAGTYDGIWAVSYGGSLVFYESIHQNGSQIIAIQFDESDVTWEALSGTLVGNSVAAQTFIGGLTANVNVTFTSSTTLTAVQTSCAPYWSGYRCLLPNGATLTGQKIF